MSPQETNARTWNWPWPPITTIRDLLRACRSGFTLVKVEGKTPSVSVYKLTRDGEDSPPGRLGQAIVVAAIRRGLFGFPIKATDGRYLLKLTTKASGAGDVTP